MEMIDKNAYTLINKQSGELAFKIFDFESISQFDHIHRLNYYSLIWIKKGTGKAIVDFNSYSYQKNYLFAFTPYQPFLFNSKSKTEGLVINFHPDFFCIYKHHSEVGCDGVLFNNIYKPPFVIVKDKSSITLNMIIQEMLKDIEDNNIAMNESVLSYLKLFLINCSRLKSHQNPEISITKGEDVFILKALKNKIENNYRTWHSPKDYALALNISLKALARISKNHLDKTITTLISERIIIEAKRELYLTGKSVKEISSELGYEDEFYFSRFFKKNTNISPSIYRKTVGFNKVNV